MTEAPAFGRWEPIETDREAAAQFAGPLQSWYRGKQTMADVLVEAFAAHRRQAEEAMRERAAKVAEDFPLAEDHPDAGMLGCRDLDIATAIRSMEVE